MHWRLTRLAERDVAFILRESRDLFGPDQATRYAALIRRAFDLVAEDPERPTSQVRSELGLFIRSLRVEVASSRRGAASHVLYYRLPKDNALQLPIVRVLHERMEPRRRVQAAMRELKRS